ncbi:unnamed protein product, partial [Ascophyllum nodosum]
ASGDLEAPCSWHSSLARRYVDAFSFLIAGDFMRHMSCGRVVPRGVVCGACLRDL